MVVTVVQRLVMETLSAYQSGKQLRWHEVELAVYLVYIFGDINKGASFTSELVLVCFDS